MVTYSQPKSRSILAVDGGIDTENTALLRRGLVFGRQTLGTIVLEIAAAPDADIVPLARHKRHFSRNAEAGILREVADIATDLDAVRVLVAQSGETGTENGSSNGMATGKALFDGTNEVPQSVCAVIPGRRRLYVLDVKPRLGQRARLVKDYRPGLLETLDGVHAAVDQDAAFGSGGYQLRD